MVCHRPKNKIRRLIQPLAKSVKVKHQYDDRLFPPPFKSPAKLCSDQGKTAWVSGGLGATNACTRMYRLAFIAEHGMRSYKAISGPPVPGARVGRP